VCRGFESLLRYQAKIKKNQQLGLTLPPSKGGLFMCDMVQHIPFIFQWVLLTTGDSAQHGCGMDRPIPKLKLACELTEDELAELLIKRADGKRGAIRAIKRAETKGKKGRPPGVTPRPGDPEALWHVYDLVQCGLGFDEAVRELVDLATEPWISILPDGIGILEERDLRSHQRRLRRLAGQYPRRSDVFSLLTASEQASPGPLAGILAPAEGNVCFACPPAELCEGTSRDI
jgi:hypothetical protein